MPPSSSRTTTRRTNPLAARCSDCRRLLCVCVRECNIHGSHLGRFTTVTVDGEQRCISRTPPTIDSERHWIGGIYHCPKCPAHLVSGHRLQAHIDRGCIPPPSTIAPSTRMSSPAPPSVPALDLPSSPISPAAPPKYPRNCVSSASSRRSLPQPSASIKTLSHQPVAKNSRSAALHRSHASRKLPPSLYSSSSQARSSSYIPAYSIMSTQLMNQMTHISDNLAQLSRNLINHSQAHPSSSPLLLPPQSGYGLLQIYGPDGPSTFSLVPRSPPTNSINLSNCMDIYSVASPPQAKSSGALRPAPVMHPKKISTPLPVSSTRRKPVAAADVVSTLRVVSKGDAAIRLQHLLNVLHNLSSCCILCWATGLPSSDHLLGTCTLGLLAGMDQAYIAFRNSLDYITGACYGCGLNTKLFHQCPGALTPTRFHPLEIGTWCPWRDLVRPLSYLVFIDKDLNALVSRLPKLENFETLSLDQWQARLSDPSDGTMLDVLEAVSTLRS